jgi:hypothetical protein
VIKINVEKVCQPCSLVQTIGWIALLWNGFVSICIDLYSKFKTFPRNTLPERPLSLMNLCLWMARFSNDREHSRFG